MKYRVRALLGAAALALLLTSAAAAAKPAKTVTVRVEGVARTLLAPTTVKVPVSGWITKGHTPTGKCSAASAAGALDVATHHRWNGTWSKNYQATELTTILGDKYSFTAKDYWSIWVDGSYAQSGICGLKLHQGEALVFAAVPLSFPITGHVLVLRASTSQARIGSTVTLTAGYKGKHGFKPVAGVTVSGGGTSLTTDKHGKAAFPITRSGTLILRASGKGYIRAAPLTVTELP